MYAVHVQALRRSSSVSRPYRIPSYRGLRGLLVSLRRFSCTKTTFPVSLPVSFPRDVNSRAYLLFLPRGHKPQPTLHGLLNPHLCLQRRRFPVPRYVTVCCYFPHINRSGLTIHPVVNVVANPVRGHKEV